MIDNNKTCSRCQKARENWVNASHWNNLNMWRPKYESELNLKIPREYLENLCNNCSLAVESFLQAFLNYETCHALRGKVIGSYEYDKEKQIIKIIEGEKVWELDLKNKSFKDNLLKISRKK